MADKTVVAGEVQAKLGDILDFVREGHEVLISDGQEPVARLVPLHSTARPKPLPRGEGPKKRIAGLHRGAIHMALDFDDPLPESFWLG